MCTPFTNTLIYYICNCTDKHMSLPLYYNIFHFLINYMDFPGVCVCIYIYTYVYRKESICQRLLF